MTHIAIRGSKLITCDRLHESFQCSYKTYVSFCCNNASVLLNFKRIELFGVSENTPQLSICYSDSDLIVKTFSYKFGHFICHNIKIVTPEGFFLLVFDQLLDMRIILILFNIFQLEQYATWILNGILG